MLKKIFISTVITILGLTTLLPAAMAAGSYTGANGQTYYNSDFEMTTTPVIYDETMYQGWGRFCIEQPTQYYEGFDFYSTEGDFVGDITEAYTPQYMSKNTSCFVHPQKFTTDTKISVQIYPYIKLESGAHKYLTPGYIDSATFKADEGIIFDEITLTASSSDNHIYVDWPPLSGLGTSFDYYRVYGAKGSYSSIPSTTGYWDIKTDYLNHDSLKTGDWWTYQVVPVKWKNGAYKEVGARSEVLKIQVKGTEAVKLETPTITYPESATVYTNNPRKAYIAWTPITGANKYEVHIDKFSDSANAWYDYNTYESETASYITPALPGDYDYRVQVRAINTADTKGTTWSEWSQYGWFKYDTSGDANVLPQPNITAPTENKVLTNYPRKAYLEWSPIYGATKYEISLACDYCNSTTTKWLNPSTYTTTNSYYTTPALAGDNDFRFKVRGLDYKGESSPWSEYRYFSYKTPSENPTPTNDQLNLWISSWKGGMPKIGWESYSETFSGYAMFVAKGHVSEDKVTWVDPSYFSKTTLSHQLTKLYSDTNYTVRILPYKEKSTGKEFVYPGTGILYFTTGNNDNYTKSVLPEAGYEDEVITNFNSYKNPFSDTNLNTLEGFAAAELYRRGVLGGYPDGEFKGYKNVNRAEIAKFLLLARYGSVSDVKNNGKFKDVKDNEWYTKFVVTAYLKGIIAGYPNGTFKPGDPVNTVEFLKMLNLTFKLQLNLKHNFKDSKSSDWFDKYVGIVDKYELFPNKSDYLNPGESLTRDEIAVAIYQYLKNR